MQFEVESNRRWSLNSVTDAQPPDPEKIATHEITSVNLSFERVDPAYVL